MRVYQMSVVGTNKLLDAWSAVDFFFWSKLYSLGYFIRSNPVKFVFARVRRGLKGTILLIHGFRFVLVGRRQPFRDLYPIFVNHPDRKYILIYWRFFSVWGLFILGLRWLYFKVFSSESANKRKAEHKRKSRR